MNVPQNTCGDTKLTEHNEIVNNLYYSIILYIIVLYYYIANFTINYFQKICLLNVAKAIEYFRKVLETFIRLKKLSRF